MSLLKIYKVICKIKLPYATAVIELEFYNYGDIFKYFMTPETFIMQQYFTKRIFSFLGMQFLYRIFC